MSKLKIVVLAKQVPDTHNVGGDAMNPDGTVNRAALPTVFNPEDLKALEMALQVKAIIRPADARLVTKIMNFSLLFWLMEFLLKLK